MEHLAGQTLVKKDKTEVSADEVLSDKEIVAFYLSGHWCPPCRAFTPILADFYKEIKEKELPFEIIFVSFDESEDELFSYMNESHGDWLALPFDSPVKSELKELMSGGIPTLSVMKKDGTLISEDAIGDVEDKGPSIYEEWIK